MCWHKSHSMCVLWCISGEVWSSSRANIPPINKSHISNPWIIIFGHSIQCWGHGCLAGGVVEWGVRLNVHCALWFSAFLEGTRICGVRMNRSCQRCGNSHTSHYAFSVGLYVRTWFVGDSVRSGLTVCVLYSCDVRCLAWTCAHHYAFHVDFYMWTTWFVVHSVGSGWNDCLYTTMLSA
jgi:hypothetical protein